MEEEGGFRAVAVVARNEETTNRVPNDIFLDNYDVSQIKDMFLRSDL